MIQVKNEIKTLPQPMKRYYFGSEASASIRLFANENPLGISAAAVEAAKIAIAKGSLSGEAEGETLRHAIGGRLGIAADQVLLGSGIDALFALLCQLFVKPQEEIILPMPAYQSYHPLAALHGAKTKGISVNSQQVVDFPAMAAAISSQTKMVFFANPNNPTGTVVSKRLFLQTMHRIGSDVLVVVDESYIDYIDHADTAVATEYLKEFPNLVVLRSFAHAYGLGGFRIAYGVTSREIAIEAEKVMLPYDVSAIACNAATAALQDKEFYQKTTGYNRLERDFLMRSLKAMGLTSLESAANFLLVDMGMDAVKVCDFLQEKDILVCGGDLFGYPKTIRVSVGLRKDNEKLLEAIKILLFRERKVKEQEDNKK